MQLNCRAAAPFSPTALTVDNRTEQIVLPIPFFHKTSGVFDSNQHLVTFTEGGHGKLALMIGTGVAAGCLALVLVLKLAGGGDDEPEPGTAGEGAVKTPGEAAAEATAGTEAEQTGGSVVPAEPAVSKEAWATTVHAERRMGRSASG